MGCLNSKEITCNICLEIINDNVPYSELPCGHSFHINCLSEHLNYKRPIEFTSLQVHDQKLGCPVCNTKLPSHYNRFLINHNKDIAKMTNAMKEFVKEEYENEKQEEMIKKLSFSTNHNYFWCNKCNDPQFIPRNITCSEKMGVYSKPKCPKCEPENFNHTCPQCNGKIYVSHGCNQIRHCVYGEKCGLNNTKKIKINGIEWDIPDPKECDHGGGCGCIFKINPIIDDVRDMSINLFYTDRILKKKLTKINNGNYLLLEYFTRHNPKCNCPGCVNQPKPPSEFQQLMNKQDLELYNINEYD